MLPSLPVIALITDILGDVPPSRGLRADLDASLMNLFLMLDDYLTLDMGLLPAIGIFGLEIGRNLELVLGGLGASFWFPPDLKASFDNISLDR